jgi:type IV pilus assembly protein PilY1
MKKTLSIIFAGLIGLFGSLEFCDAYTEPVMADYTSYPLFLTDAVEPNIMVILDNSGSMNYNAYGAYPGDNQVVGSSYNGTPYNVQVKTIATSSDDSEQRDSDGYNYYGSNTDLDIGRDISATYESMHVGLRFQNIDVEPGAVIQEAYLTFTTYADYSSANEADIDIAIHGESSDNAATFTSAYYDISSRTKTSQSVTWTIPEWDTPDVEHQTPDLAGVVQEIVNRSGWAPGNAMAFVLSNPAGNPASGRRAYGYEGSPGKAPRLHIKVAQVDAARYYGYFNPDFFYANVGGKFNHKYKKVSYDNTNNQWIVISDLSTINSATPTTRTLSDADIVAEGLWDGNWMNWCTMRRIDVLRKVLMGGLATARTGGGNQTNYGETPKQSNRNFIRHFDTTSSPAVTPYDGNYYYEINGGYIYVGTDPRPSTNYIARFTLAIQKQVAYEPQDFVNYDSGDNLGGVLQRYGDKARWGNMWFNYGTGKGESGGRVAATIGTNMVSLVTDLQNTGADTWTPLAETYYVATQYFKQEDVASGLDYPNNVVPNANVGDDPYYNGTEFVHCAKSFVILLTDGASTKDTKIPDFLKDFDNDGKDHTACGESDFCNYGDGGTDYLDDIALYARTTDLRSPTVGKTDLEGEQNLILYVVYAMGDDDNARSLLKDAARAGGFEDRNGNNRPDGDYTDPPEDRLEWDKNGDGLPDTYFEASDGYKLEKALGAAITDILRRAASGTSVSIISSATEGEGNIIQAYFRPSVPSDSGPEDIKWIGSLQALWIDPMGNMREDTPAGGASEGDKALDITHDKIIKFVDVGGETKIEKYLVSALEPYPDVDAIMPDETVALSDMSAFSPLWEAGAKLGHRAASDRKIFTYLDRDGDQQVPFGENPFDSSGEVIEFTTANTDIRPYLGVQSDAAWEHLGATHTDRFENIVKFIRGENSGFTGNARIRDRSVPTNPADVQNTLVDWKLGDIVHSTPVIVAKPFENYDLLYRDESYARYYQAVKDRESVVYAGANDGMIHAFTSWKYDSSTQSYSQPAGTFEDIGDELWAYIPQTLLPHLKWLPDQDYTHVYYADSRVKVFEAKILPDNTHYSDPVSGKNWGTFLIAGLNYGGKHIWAQGDFDNNPATPDEVRHFYPAYVCIDVTDPRNPRLMWEKSYSMPASPAQTSENVTDLGLTTSFPAILKVGEKWFAVFGSGPHDFEGTSSSNGHIFVVDLATGLPHQKDGTTSPTTGLPNQDGTSDWLFETAETRAFMANPVSLDKNMNYNVDAIYVPQTHNDGNATNPKWRGAVYRIRVPFRLNATSDPGVTMITNYGDLDNGYYVDDPNNPTDPWDLSKLFLSPAPITSAPTLSIGSADNAWIFFGTGRYLSETDKLDITQQYIYGIKDPFFNSGYVTSPSNYYYNPGSSKIVTTADLLNTDSYTILNSGQMSDDGTTISSDPFKQLVGEMDSYDGWERTLFVSGERMIEKPAIIGGALFATSFVPNQDICSYGGDSYLYGLYYETGTAYTKPFFVGSQGIENVTLDGNIHQKVVDVIYLGEGLASSPGIHVGKQQGNQATGFIQTSKGLIESLNIDPALSIRSGLETWREK